MSQAFDDYCRRLRAEADALGLEVEAHSRFDHQHAFNLGRSVGRLEHARDAFWIRVRWLFGERRWA